MPLIKIVITGNKGGTGKTTIAALLAEYLNHLGKKAQLIDSEELLRRNLLGKRERNKLFSLLILVLGK